MDFLIINVGIPHSICHLAGFYVGDPIFHRFDISIHIRLRHIIDDRSDSLRNCFRGYYDNILVFCKTLGLICRKDDILIIGEDENVVRIYMVDSGQHIIRTRIHSLSALDDIVHAQFPEYLIHPLADRNSDKANRFSGFFFLLKFSCLGLLFRYLLRITDQFLLVLLAHIVNLHPGELAVCESFLDSKSRVVCVDMDLHDIVVRNADNRIADGLQVRLELGLVRFRERLVCHNDKFRTVAELDICLCLLGRFHHFCSRTGVNSRVVDLLAGECVVCPVKDLNKPLSAGIHDSGFFQYGKHIRGLSQHIFCVADDLWNEHLQIFRSLCKFARFLRDAFCNGEDRSLLRLHNCFVCCRRRSLAGFCENRHINFLIIADFFCKSS